MIFLNLEEVIEIHNDLVSKFGGQHGIRDVGLLISAIEMPKATMFGEYLHDSIFDKAAAYLYHIVCNHAFIDGNKRTGAATALIFLYLNAQKFQYHQKDLENLVCSVAEGTSSKEEVSKFLQMNSSIIEQ